MKVVLVLRLGNMPLNFPPGARVSIYVARRACQINQPFRKPCGGHSDGHPAADSVSITASAGAPGQLAGEPVLVRFSA